MVVKGNCFIYFSTYFKKDAARTIFKKDKRPHGINSVISAYGKIQMHNKTSKWLKRNNVL